ncbi:inversin-like protein [Carex littledalei]|uniref:Inversin-like protein n=1 Tax=Carex littledalei TaxID=544730 RepID=A0A833RDU0_9POAL|nr:inversin-like protein [Carex littledalei]
MAESDHSSEIQEESPYQAPNSHLAAEEEQRINPELLRAIVNGDLMLFKSILGIEGEPIDIESIRESNGGNNGLRGVAYGENTALHVVAGVMEKSSQIPIFQMFLFSVVAIAFYEETPLHCAANAGNIHMVSLLVEFAREQGREDPEKLKRVLWARNKVGETALHEAARSGYSGIVKELLRADETLACLEDDNGISPLYLAVFAGCHDVVQQLIDATPLNAETITRAILDWNQSLAAKTDKARNTPLHYAALIGNTYAVKKLLLKDTGPVYRKNLSGSFPVHLAAEAGNVKVIKELLSMCPDVGELLDKEKRNFLHVAVEKKKIEK